jgi:hypothetical protein
MLTWDVCPYLYQSTTCKKTPVSSAFAGFLDVEIQQARAEHLEAQAQECGVEHVYQTCIVVLLANPTNGQKPIGHRPASPGRRGPGCLEPKHALVKVRFRKYTRRDPRRPSRIQMTDLFPAFCSS